MLRFPNASGLSPILASVCLAIALPQAGFAATPDTLPKANPFGPAQVLTDSSVLGRWEINSHDLGDKEDPLNRGRAVFHFYADHKVEMHIWSMFTDSTGPATVYNGSRMSGTWFVRDTLLGIVGKECEGFNAIGEKECGIMESHEDFGHDTDWSVVKPREGKRYIVDADMSGMLAWQYRGADRDITPPSFWTGAAPVRPRAYGLQRKPGPAPAAPLYDLLGRRPVAQPAVTPRFRERVPAIR
jgi:hypothetical protein